MNDTPLIGRQWETSVLEESLDSPSSELIAVVGRRRVGKTFLIRSTYSGAIRFQMSGIMDASLKEQLYHFHQQLKRHGYITDNIPSSWIEAFGYLTALLEQQPSNKHMGVVFFDELPWLATQHSGFLQAFGSFWNDWASLRRIVVVVCGSATSWMIRHVVNAKGGLHNRITKTIDLHPFTLQETESFLAAKGSNMNRSQILEIYMVTGGIPYYLNNVKPGQSAIQNIQHLCFDRQGLLYDEFSKLYGALFKKPERYIQVIRSLASKWKGLTREEILSNLKLKDGGSISTILKDLELSGFIQSYLPFNKTRKTALYRLTDPYSLFYLKFIEGNPYSGSNVWQQMSQSQMWKSWSGYAFENVCLLHIEGIKQSLGISGILTSQSSFYFRGNETHSGMQIDLLIDRADKAINVCEMKYYSADVRISKTYARQLRERLSTFANISKTRKQLFHTLITIYGLHSDKNSLGVFDHVLDLDALFSAQPL